MSTQSSSSLPPHIVFLPSLGMGHLIPLAELATRLVTRHNLTATFLTFSPSSSSQSSFLSSLPPSISSLSLPPVSLSDLPSDSKIETIISVTVARSLPAISSLLSRLSQSHNILAFFADIFGADAISVAKRLSIPYSYIFFPSNFLCLSVLLNLPSLDAASSCEFRDLPDPISLPGCVPLLGSDLLDPLQDRNDDAYRWVLHQGKHYRDADAILVNTFDAIEPGTADALKDIAKVYPVGPLVTRPRGTAAQRDVCVEWLDSQPRASVLYVSFGSGGTLTTEQTAELAFGLEMSGQRFLWVARSPSDHKSDANFFDAESAGDPLAFLPEGFLERTKEVGLVVPSWAPQMEVLSHEATGGFLTHCGWNSVLESVVSGVGMLAWPLYAEQKMNAVMLTERSRIALRVRKGRDGVARREAVAKAVRGLMEGEEGKEVRRRVRNLKEEGEKSLGEDGKSLKALDELANKWKNITPLI